ncbi:MAG: hypothetical protein MI741_15055 [Rhodospirillales bacterium]|nr:hypothetical protein [Rhodospirillales bacterium]
MRWYIVEHDVTEGRNSFATISEHMTDAEGRDLEDRSEVDGPLLDEWCVGNNYDIRQVGKAYLKLNRRKRIGDLLHYRIHGRAGTALIVSDKTVALLDEAGIRIDSSVYRWPLEVVDSVTKKTCTEYTIMWPTRRWPILDLALADVKFYKNSDVISRVNRWVVDSDLIPEFSVFMSEQNRWLVSDCFKSIVAEHRLTGFDFHEVEISGIDGKSTKEAKEQ